MQANPVIALEIDNMLTGAESISGNSFDDFPAVFRIDTAVCGIDFNGIIRGLLIPVDIQANDIISTGIIPDSINDSAIFFGNAGQVISKVIIRRNSLPERIVIIIISGCCSSRIRSGI